MADQGRKIGSKAAETRARILRAAVALFSEKGFDATPTSEVAQAADVPQGLVFYYFKKKIDILLAIAEEQVATDEHLRRAIQRNLEDPQTTLSPMLAIATGLREALAASRQTRSIIFREMAAHPDVRARATEVRRRAISLVTNEVHALTGADVEHAGAAARLLVAEALLTDQLGEESDGAAVMFLDHALMASIREARLTE